MIGDEYPLTIQSPGDWIPRGIATDCLWYEQFQGNEMCDRHKIQLGLDDEPCFLCKDYKQFMEGQDREKLKAQNLFDSGSTAVDRNGQYYIRGM